MVRPLRLSVRDTRSSICFGTWICLYTDGRHRIGSLCCRSELAGIVDAVELSLFRARIRGNSRLPGVLVGTMADA